MNLDNLAADGLAVAGAATILYACNLWLLGRASEQWPQAEGILDSTIIEEHHHNSGRGSGYTDFSIGVKYHFVVGEKVFTGRRLRFGGTSFATRKDAAAESSHLRDEAPLVVYYDPGNPTRSSLERGVGTDVYGVFTIGAIAIIASFIMVLRA